MSYNYQDAPRESQQEYFGKVHTDNKETLYNALKRIEELEKENEELRNNGFTVSAMTEQQLKVAIEKGKQLEKELTNAKEHIRTLISCLIDWVQEGDKDYCYIADAEQFLKELEK